MENNLIVHLASGKIYKNSDGLCLVVVSEHIVFRSESLEECLNYLMAH